MNLIKNVIGKNIVVSGIGAGGEPIKSVTMNANGTFTIVDTENVSHTATPTYTNGKITALTYDGQSVAITYDTDGNLIKVGNADIDGLEEYPEIETQTKSVTITQNGSTTITPDANKYLSSVGVTVNVPNPSSGSLSITENGTYDVTEKASAVVNVPQGITPLAKTVTFKNGADNYQVVTVTDGQTIAQPPTNPPSATGLFNGWQKSGSTVSFPYTPIGNDTLSAYFQTVRTEMEITSAETVLMNGDWKKKNDGLCIAAVGRVGNWFPVLLSTENVDYTKIKVDRYDSGNSGTYTYNGTTYYYSSTYGVSMASVLYTTSLWSTEGSTLEEVLENILDHYFYADGT